MKNKLINRLKKLKNSVLSVAIFSLIKYIIFGAAIYFLSIFLATINVSGNYENGYYDVNNNIWIILVVCASFMGFILFIFNIINMVRIFDCNHYVKKYTDRSLTACGVLIFFFPFIVGLVLQSKLRNSISDVENMEINEPTNPNTFDPNYTYINQNNLTNNSNTDPYDTPRKPKNSFSSN